MDVILSLLNPSGTAPIQATQGVQSPQSATTGGSGPKIPSVLANLPPGTLVNGFVLSRDTGGNPILRTDRGDFVLQSQFFLKIGSDVLIRLENTGAQPRANLISVDGLPPQDAENIPAHATNEDYIQRSGTPAANQPATQRPTPAGTPATPQNATPQSAATISQPAPAARGADVLNGTLTQPASNSGNVTESTTVALRIVQIGTSPLADAFTRAPLTTASASVNQPRTVTGQPAAPGAAPVLPDETVQDNAAESLPAAPRTASQPATSQQQAPQGYQVYARQSGTVTPSTALPPNVSQGPAAITPAPAQASPATPGANFVDAAVVQLDTAGAPILATPLGLLRLHSSLPLTVGTTVKLELLNFTPGTSPTPATAPLPQLTLPALAAQWGTLQDILHLLQTLDEPSAGTLIRQFSPGTSASAPFTPMGLSASLFFFINALKGGDFRSFIGHAATSALETHGQGELLKRAEAEFSVLKQYFTDTGPQQWQPMFLPVLLENETRMLRFYVKRDRKGGRDRDHPQGADTRFVVEMDLSALGPVQLDGLVKKQEDHGTHFDLIIRSRGYLDNDAQQEIRNIFTMVGDTTGYKGMLMFQLVDDFPVKPLDEILSETSRQVLA